MNKRLMAVLLGLFTAMPVAFAAPFGGMFGRVFDRIISIGNLDWLGASSSAVGLGFTRILIWILLFTLFFALAPMLPGGKEKKSLFSRSQSMVVAAILATISSIFLPPTLVLATGAGFGTMVGLVLVGGPIIGLSLLLWKIPGSDKGGNKIPETKGDVVLKLFIVAILWWVLAVVANHLGTGDPVTKAVSEFAEWGLTILSILVFWYIGKFFFVPNHPKDDPNADWEKKGSDMRDLVSDFMKKQEDKNTALNKELEERKKKRDQAKKDKEESRKSEEERLKKESEAKAVRDLRNSGLDPIKGFLLRARNKITDATDMLSDVLDERTIKRAEDILESVIKTNIRSARRGLRYQRHNFKDNVDEMHKLVAHIDHLREEMKELIEKIPKTHEGYSDYIQKETEIITSIDVILSELNELIMHEHHKVKELQHHHNQERAKEKLDNQVKDKEEAKEESKKDDDSDDSSGSSGSSNQRLLRRSRPRARFRPRSS